MPIVEHAWLCVSGDTITSHPDREDATSVARLAPSALVKRLQVTSHTVRWLTVAEWVRGSRIIREKHGELSVQEGALVRRASAGR